MGARSEKRIRKLESRVPIEESPALSSLSSFSLTSIRSSILPPVSELERLESLSPGATSKIIEIVEKQGTHRRDLEKYVIAGDSKRADKGQVFAFILGVVALVGGFALILLGKDAGGVASIISATSILMGAFFGGAILRKIERQKKLQQMNNKKR